MRLRVLIAVALAAGLVLVDAAPGVAQEVTWVRRWGSRDDDIAMGVAASSDAVYVVGDWTARHPRIRRYTPEGGFVWQRKVGATPGDWVGAVEADSESAYVAGVTWGAFPGQRDRRGTDVFLVRYRADGSMAWARRFRAKHATCSPDSEWWECPGWDTPTAVAVDASGVYVVGFVSGPLPGQRFRSAPDAFVRKYGRGGKQLWTRQFGSSSADHALDVALAPGIVYVVGATYGRLPGKRARGSHDAFLRKYRADGTLLWTRQFGTPSSDVARGVVVASDGTVFVGGSTGGRFGSQPNPKGPDGFLRAYAPNGRRLWTRQFGGAGEDTVEDVAWADGRAVLVGSSDARIPGDGVIGTTGGSDALVVAFDPDGDMAWARRIGSWGYDWGLAVAAQPGQLYIAGSADKRFLGTKGHGRDAFVLRMTTGPDSEG